MGPFKLTVKTWGWEGMAWAGLFVRCVAIAHGEGMACAGHFVRCIAIASKPPTLISHISKMIGGLEKF
ncbi:hypothetical protein SUGI_1086000 [Cryptomeria japonica]|nr:hypothetical protein SUGI_1086000 [Cryptomeria japonica]